MGRSFPGRWSLRPGNELSVRPVTPRKACGMSLPWTLRQIPPPSTSPAFARRRRLSWKRLRISRLSQRTRTISFLIGGRPFFTYTLHRQSPPFLPCAPWKGDRVALVRAHGTDGDLHSTNLQKEGVFGTSREAVKIVHCFVRLFDKGSFARFPIIRNALLHMDLATVSGQFKVSLISRNESRSQNLN